jgi:hypothetical protein
MAMHSANVIDVLHSMISEHPILSATQTLKKHNGQLVSRDFLALLS